MRRSATLVAIAVITLVVVGLAGVVQVAARSDAPHAPSATVALVPEALADPGGASRSGSEPVDQRPNADAVAAVSLPLEGCPPPPRLPSDVPPAPTWRPPVLVPEADLPTPAPAPAWLGDLTPMQGKGMWVWKYRQTEAGNPDAIVSRAVDAGLRQLWVRVGDSRDGFYGADVLAELVPRAQAQGLAVIGWGFPFLWDPVADANWSAEAIGWRGPGGSRLDGFSPDIEMESEGVVLSERRAQVYLDITRQAAVASGQPLVATVYRPSDIVWGEYPYDAIAPYVDAFAPMVYWGCTEPGDAAIQAVNRLASKRPVHLIGQAYDMSEEGAGRLGAPSAAETNRFLDVARRQGALGASFWVWQSIEPEQWAAMAAFSWPAPAPLPETQGDP